MFKKCQSLFQSSVIMQTQNLNKRTENCKKVKCPDEEWQEEEEPPEEDAKKHLDLLYSEVIQGKNCTCLCKSPIYYELIGPTCAPKNNRLFFLPRRSRKIYFSPRVLKRKRFLSRRTLF